LGCVVVGVLYCGGGYVYCVVWLLVCGVVVGVMCIVLCGCWCVVLWWGLCVLGCVVVGVWYPHTNDDLNIRHTQTIFNLLELCKPDDGQVGRNM